MTFKNSENPQNSSSSNDAMNSKKSDSDEKGFFSSLSSFVLIIVLVFGFKSSFLDANNIPSGSMLPTLKIGDFLFVNKMRYSFRMPFTEKELIRFDNPKRGDIVTFIPPDAALSDDEKFEDEKPSSFRKLMKIALPGIFSKRFVKRLVGMPGDQIRITQQKIKNHKGDLIDYSIIEFKPKGSTEFQSFRPTPISPGKELSDLDNSKAVGRSLFTEEKNGFKHFVLEGRGAGRLPFIEYYCDTKGVCEIPEDYYMVVGDNRNDSSDSRFWGFVKRENILGKALILYFSINWKDYSCMLKDEVLQKEDITGKDLESIRYEGNELYKRCHPLELTNSFLYGESLTTWFERTLKYRIWRMDVRWKRIFKILE